MRSKFLGYAQLARPANLPTAAADILAGIAITGIIPVTPYVDYYPSVYLYKGLILVLCSVFLYASGVILNDVFDAKIDAAERPERPIPSGLIPLRSAALFGAALMILGVLIAFYVSNLSGFLALALAISILSYDGFSKKYAFLGPLNMGACRALNLILGMTILGELLAWEYGMIPLTYIFAITLVSRGEVEGNNKTHLIWAAILYAIVIFGVLISVPTKLTKIMEITPFILLFAFMIYKPLIRAYKTNTPGNIKKAVISGVLALILLNASLAVGFSFWWYGLLVLLLLPLSIGLSKLFAVT